MKMPTIVKSFITSGPGWMLSRSRTGRTERKCALGYIKMHIFRFIPRMRKIHPGIAFHWYILSYPVIRLADSESPDQIARMRKLIWAFTARICVKAHFWWRCPCINQCCYASRHQLHLKYIKGFIPKSCEWIWNFKPFHGITALSFSCYYTWSWLCLHTTDDFLNKSPII